jgi:hypothetical protein
MARLNVVTTRYRQPPLDDVFELFDRCSRVLVLTSPSFDFAAPRLPANVRYVGPQLQDPDWAASTAWHRRGTDPLVLVATSSVYQHQLDLLQRIAHALGQLPVQAILTTGQAIDPRTIHAPPNVEAVQAAPHSRILPEASAVHPRRSRHRPEVPGGRRSTDKHPDGSGPEGQHGPRAPPRRRRAAEAAVHTGSDRRRRDRGPAQPSVRGSRSQLRARF